MAIYGTVKKERYCECIQDGLTHTHYRDNMKIRERGRRNKVRMLTPTMHCQTHTIDHVGMNQASAAEEVDRFSSFIISVSLMLPGKKRWRRTEGRASSPQRNKVS